MGRDYVRAVDKARAYATEHDALINSLKTPEERDKQRINRREEIAANFVHLPAGMLRQIDEHGKLVDVQPMNRNPGDWQDTPARMKTARAYAPDQELKQLAIFKAYAFGDRSTLDVLPEKSPLGNALADVMRPTRPNDPTDGAMYDAYEAALAARIGELGGGIVVDAKHTLSYLHDVIARSRNSKPNTIQNHKMTTAKFNKFLETEKGITSELPLSAITDTLLHEYLEYLLNDPKVTNGSIAKYFDGIRSVFNYAIKNKKVPGLVVNPVDFVEMPRSLPVEQTMYLPFNPTEMANIWDAVQNVWGPDNHKSRLSPERRAAFLMCFRVLLWSSLRPVEVFWLRDNGEVTPDYIHTVRNKTDIERYIPLSDHIADFHGFMANGGLDACIYKGKVKGEAYGKYNPEKLKEVMRASFAEIREAVGITNPRKVLYSTKDTLLQRMRGTKGYTTFTEVGKRGLDPTFRCRVYSASPCLMGLREFLHG